jgi:hypothetical protein
VESAVLFLQAVFLDFDIDRFVVSSPSALVVLDESL